jgi:hypothetical protein
MSGRIAAAVAMTVAGVAVLPQTINGAGPAEKAGGGTTVIRNQPLPGGDNWSAEQMRAAKPLPLPSIDGPPVPPHATPNPFSGPVLGSPPGLGGTAPR